MFQSKLFAYRICHRTEEEVGRIEEGISHQVVEQLVHLEQHECSSLIRV